MDVPMPGGPSSSSLVGVDGLSVQGYRINKSIRNFDEAYVSCYCLSSLVH
jgi:hypothetical protein